MTLALEVVAHDEAHIVSENLPTGRMVLKGAGVDRIVSSYKHLLTHPETGDMDARIYLWGVLHGMEHAAWIAMTDVISDIRRRNAEEVQRPE